MSKLLRVFPHLNYLLILGFFFFSLLLHNYTNDRRFSLDQTPSNPISEYRMDLIDADHDHHEDDLASPDKIIPHIRADLASLLRVSRLSHLSHIPGPLITPPKTV
jgi:hypothetical protein